MIYLLLALFVYVCFALKNNKIIKTTAPNKIIVPSERNEQKISWLAVIVLILFSGVRANSVGIDLASYRFNFQDIATSKSLFYGNEKYEPFHIILCRFCALFGSIDWAFTNYLLVLSVINVLLVVYVAKSISKDISLTMFLFVCVDIYIPSFCLLRQSIAVTFIILSFKYLYEKKFVKFLTCVFVASCFHNTAILMMLLYLLNQFRKNIFNYGYYILGVILIIVFVIFDERIVYILCDLLNFNYFSYYYMGADPMTMLSRLKAWSLVFVWVFFVGYKIYRDAKNKPLSRKYNLSLNIYFITALISLYNIYLDGFGIIARMSYYFSWALIILVPEFLDSIENKKWKRIFTIIMIVVGVCYLSTVVVLRDQFGVMPYSTIFK